MQTLNLVPNIKYTNFWILLDSTPTSKGVITHNLRLRYFNLNSNNVPNMNYFHACLDSKLCRKKIRVKIYSLAAWHCIYIIAVINTVI